MPRISNRAAQLALNVPLKKEDIELPRLPHTSFFSLPLSLMLEVARHTFSSLSLSLSQSLSLSLSLSLSPFFGLVSMQQLVQFCAQSRPADLMYGSSKDNQLVARYERVAALLAKPTTAQ